MLVVAKFRPGCRGRLLRWMSPVTACLLVTPVVVGIAALVLPHIPMDVGGANLVGSAPAGHPVGSVG